MIYKFLRWLYFSQIPLVIIITIFFIIIIDLIILIYKNIQ